MKYFYVVNVRIPTEKAHGLQIAQMMEAFGDLKINVELIIPRRFNKIKQDVFEYYGVEKNFKVTKLPCVDLIPLSGFLGNFALWVQTVTFLISAKIYLLFKNYDILYTREQFVGVFFRNFVFEVHSLPKIIKQVHIKIWQKSKALVVLTGYIKKEITKAEIPEGKILVSPDAVDLDEFSINESQEECRSKLNLPQDKKIVMYTGHLYDWKGAGVLAEAARQFSTDVLFVFVGGTDEDIKKFKSQSSKLKNVFVAGQKPHSEIPVWLKAADVLVLPNTAKEKISKYYTSPMKLFEYMASKRPIIASDLPSIKEILDTSTCVFCESDNPNDLANKIKLVLKDKNLSQKISVDAYKKVQNYTWKKRAESIINFINKNKH